MSVPRAVSRTRILLLLLAVGLVLLYTAGIQTLVLALAHLGGATPNVARMLARAAGFVTAAAVLWRWRRVYSTPQVALWLEERAPEFQYAVVTRLEPRYAGISGYLDQAIGTVPLRARLSRVAGRRLLPAAIVAAVGFTALAIAARDDVPRVARSAGVIEGAASLRIPAPLADLSVRIEPPAYTGQQTRDLRDPEAIQAIVGSRVTIRGRWPAEDVTARLGASILMVGGDEWRTAFTMPPEPRALRLRHAPTGAERVLVVEPVQDMPPRAVLTAPARDTMFRAAPANIRVAAEISDDIGLADATIEYMISSGEGETFVARTGRAVTRNFAGARSGRLSGALTGAELRLGPGDMLSIRAMARDRNTVSGPGVGTSDTRTIRIARGDEYDSLSVEAMAPMFGDSALLSQRMILQRTEQLVRALPSLSRDSLVRRAAEIAFDQERLRDRVHSVVYPGHEHADESPMAGEPPDHAEPADPVDADLKVAYEAMWEAGRELRIASPATAVPPMRVAADALDRARLGSRVYLRGGTARVVVDIDRVRLTGTERGQSSLRPPRARADTLRHALVARLARLAADTVSPPQARINALSELRVELLPVSPRAAGALAAASDAIRAGRDPREGIAAATRELAGEATVSEQVPPWSRW
jgi:hypothetical protein